MALGELGRFPIQNKAISLAVSYWSRLEHGTDNLILNKAYTECKTNNHKWYNDIYYLLQSNGLQNILDNTLKYSPKLTKKIVNQRLNDQHIQKYDCYIKENNSNRKSEILHKCAQDTRYDIHKYLKTVRNPLIRNTITRLRIDANKLEDCKYRSVRFKNTPSDLCSECNIRNDVEHSLYFCKKGVLVQARKCFINRYSKFNPNIDMSNNIPVIHISEMLNLEPKVKSKDKEQAIDTICTYLKQIYNAL
jgi:hypothetical protein